MRGTGTKQWRSAAHSRIDDMTYCKYLSRARKMWDDHLGQVSGVEHHIDLVPKAKRHRSVPYRSGIRIRDIEKAEVEKIVDQGVEISTLRLIGQT